MSLIVFAFSERVMCVVWMFSPPPHSFLAGTHRVVIGKLVLLVAPYKLLFVPVYFHVGYAVWHCLMLMPALSLGVVTIRNIAPRLSLSAVTWW